jgi:hypothetical protein
MLRASIEYSGADAALNGISDGAKAGDGGIEHGERLSAFADASVQGGAAELSAARDALRDAAGAGAVVDAAAVIGNFERMVRIADGTGVPLDNIVATLSSDFREELGLDDYQSRRMVEPGSVVRVIGPWVRGAIHASLRFAGRWSRRRNQAG